MAETENADISDLIPDPKNARAHPEENMVAIKTSLNRFGQVEPLVVQRSTNIVVGGNGRLLAMREMGWETAKVVFLDIDDTEATALGLALNRTAELAEWDGKGLAEALKSLEGVGTDFGDDFFESMSFDATMISAALGEQPEFTNEATGATEITEAQIGGQEHQCPRCGFVY